ncbi:MAG: nitroreductase family deazaflavin-dependent oxidoreductase [Mycobacterium sp.]
MSFDTPNGTRGARQPRAGRLFRFLNGMMMTRIRRSHGKTMGMDALVLTTIGAKSGQPRSSPLAYFAEDAQNWLIVASAAGAPRNPAWYYNLAAHPDQVRIEIGDRTVDVAAAQLHGEERTRAWQRITSASKQFAKYQEKTDREIPIIRLTARQPHA